MTRLNMHDIIVKKEFDVSWEYEHIRKLFNTREGRSESLCQLIDGGIQFFPTRFRKRALTLADFNEIYGFSFDLPNPNVTIEELITYCEYVITLCNHLKEYAEDILEKEAEFLLYYLYETVENCMDELGLVAATNDNITIYIEKDPFVLAVAESVNESLAYEIKSFIHKDAKGDLKKKKAILTFLHNEIEPKRKILRDHNLTSLEKMLFQLFDKFIRHNNDDNQYIANMSSYELENCYDDIYQLWLLAMAEINNIERKQRVDVLLKSINNKTI